MTLFPSEHLSDMQLHFVYLLIFTPPLLEYSLPKEGDRICFACQLDNLNPECLAQL